MIKLQHIIILGIILFFSSCEKNILDRYPEDAMSDATFFSKSTDFKMYMNGLYGGIDRQLPFGDYGMLPDIPDNSVDGNAPFDEVMLHSASGQAPNSSGTWNSCYEYIRQVNYLIQNKDKAESTDVVAQHYIGEAYFCRAYKYFTLLQAFGGVPYVDKVLNTDSEELYSKRESRDVIATKIIEDLDKAISSLYWKGNGEAVDGRVNKEMALLLKSRVALYEGSWEHYHGLKSTPFKVIGKDGAPFLEKVIEAGDVLITKYGSNIYRGSLGAEYESLFNQYNYENIPGAFFYKHYDTGLDVSHGAKSFFRGYRFSATKSAVDTYLMKDGKPIGLSSVTYDKTNQNSFIHSRDPRLAQTIYAPDRGNYIEVFNGRLSGEDVYATIYPDLNHAFVPNSTGYRVIKGTSFSITNFDTDDKDDLIMRYAEVLLNYAEAKAILGTISQGDIDKTINVLRGRVGMASMNIAEVNSWNINYSEKLGYDPTALNILNEIRRERRVELMFEGFRMHDLKRWALLENVINGYKPQGAYFSEIFDYWNNHDILAAAGMSESEINQKKLVEGVNCERVGDYVRPLWRNADFTVSGRGYYINPERDYLNAIPKGEIDLYDKKGGVVLEQNPGWF